MKNLLRSFLLLLLWCSPAYANRYFLIFFADASAGNPGHGFVSFVNEDSEKRQTVLEGCWGFYPAKANASEIYSSAIFSIPGEVQPDLGRQRTYGFTIQVSAAEYQSAKITKNQWLRKPYSLAYQNCKDFLIAIASNIVNPNFKKPGPHVYPIEYVKDLKLLNSGLEFDGTSSGAENAANAGAAGQTAELPESFRLTAGRLFSGPLRGISDEDKATIIKDANIQYADNQIGFVSTSNPGIRYNYARSVITDINDDGVKEILINMIGKDKENNRSVFYIKTSASAPYTAVFSSTGEKAPLILKEKTAGYNSIYTEDKGAGKVFKWNGAKYIFARPVDKTIVWVTRNALDFNEPSNRLYNEENYHLKSINPLETMDELKDLSGRNKNAKIGDPQKFLGGWWQMGYYKYPIFIKKNGSTFAIAANKFTSAMTLSYNVKTDLLETWVQRPGIKVKIIVKYDYAHDQIDIRPESGGYGVWSNLNFSRYSF